MSEAVMLNAATEALHNLYSTTPENGALSLASIAQAVLEAANVGALLGERDGLRFLVDEQTARIMELQAEIAALKAELAKHQQSSFHPDWSALKETRESLREAWAKLKEMERTAADALKEAGE